MTTLNDPRVQTWRIVLTEVKDTHDEDFTLTKNITGEPFN